MSNVYANGTISELSFTINLPFGSHESVIFSGFFHSPSLVHRWKSRFWPKMRSIISISGANEFVKKNPKNRYRVYYLASNRWMKIWLTLNQIMTNGAYNIALCISRHFAFNHRFITGPMLCIFHRHQWREITLHWIKWFKSLYSYHMHVMCRAGATDKCIIL